MATVASEYTLSKETRQFLDRAGSMWINGQWKSRQVGRDF